MKLIDEYIVTRPDREKQKIGSQLFSFAQNAFNDGKYQYAIQAYTLLLSRYPDSPYAGNSKYGMANSYENIGEYDQAIVHYQKAIELRPDYLIAMANLVDTYVHKKDYEEAKIILEALRKLNPNHYLVRERIEDYQEILWGTMPQGGE